LLLENYLFINMTSRKDERLVIAPIGEYYNDLLTVDSWIRDTTKSQQASSLLCSKLQEREQRIKERIEYLAKKRGITSDELWINILKGTAKKIDADEISIE
jgi:hypothetical protein